MTTWVTERTWTDGEDITAARLNTIRDNLKWLKTLLTDDTDDANSGLRIRRTTSGAIAFESRIGADTGFRFAIRAGGGFAWADADGFTDLTLTPDNANKRLLFAAFGADGSTPANAQVGVELAATPGEYNAVFVRANGQSQPRIALGITSDNKPRVGFGDGTTAPDLWIVRNAAGRLQAEASSGHARLGALLGDTSSEANAIYVWAGGDTFPRVALGQSSDGLPAIRLGAGSASATDIELVRESARSAALRDAKFTIYRDSEANPGIALRKTGDSSDRLGIYPGYIKFTEQSAPTAPNANDINVFARDNGSGKTQYVVQFSDGTITALATQP